MTGTAHQREILGDDWIYIGVENGLEVYIHRDHNWINLFNPKTNEMLED
ncbi:hypothetical protein [Ammoniphilus sp. 3BR4]